MKPVMVKTLRGMTMKKTKQNDSDRPRPQNEHLRQPQAEMPRQRAEGLVECLFGKMMHLSFIVEHGAKVWCERSCS